MYSYEKGGLSVNIDAEPGVYMFEPESATGKSYLGMLLDKLYQQGERVEYFTYGDWLKGLRPKFEGMVTLLDRVDMYPEVLKQVPTKPSGVVLIDCKALSTIPFKVANIAFEPWKVKVWR